MTLYLSINFIKQYIKNLWEPDTSDPRQFGSKNTSALVVGPNCLDTSALVQKCLTLWTKLFHHMVQSVLPEGPNCLAIFCVKLTVYHYCKFEKVHTTSYSFSIETMHSSCTIFEGD